MGHHSQGPTQAQVQEQNQLNQELQQQKKQLAIQRQTAQRKNLLDIAQSLGSESDFNDLNLGLGDGNKGKQTPDFWNWLNKQMPFGGQKKGTLG